MKKETPTKPGQQLHRSLAEIEMERDLLELIKSYLESVNTVLTIFKSKVGDQVIEDGKSWESNIPDNGHYSDVGISKFHRHGVGIWAYYQGKFVDFDFGDLNLPESNQQKFISIYVYFLAQYAKSLNIKDKNLTDYNLLEGNLKRLVDKELLKNIGYKYYLKEDLMEYFS